jgi:antitoxin MazE
MRVFKWGDSLAVRLPKALIDQFGLKEGDELEVVAARDGTIVNIRARKSTLPADYKFDRDEANKR